MNEQEFAELAAGHALHALTAADERRYREALAAHPEWAHIADTDAQTAAALAEMLPPVAPPQALRADLLAQIAQTPQTPDAADVAPPAPPAAPIAPQPDADVAQPKWGRRLFALAASLVLLVGLGVGTTAVVSQLGRPASVVALDEIRSAPDAADATVQLPGGATATAYWSASLGRSVLVTEELPDLEPGLTYELWYVRGDQPISAGIFDTDGGDATAELDGQMHDGDVIAVTVERAGGSPTGAPTSNPVIVIPTA